jgi:hypothetical protein
MIQALPAKVLAPRNRVVWIIQPNGPLERFSLILLVLGVGRVRDIKVRIVSFCGSRACS